jgi:hypothetical protein
MYKQRVIGLLLLGLLTIVLAACSIREAAPPLLVQLLSWPQPTFFKTRSRSIKGSQSPLQKPFSESPVPLGQG